jgi:hypothetical protein
VSFDENPRLIAGERTVFTTDIRTVVPALGGMLGFGNIRIVTAAGDAGRDAFTAVRDPMTFKRHVLEQKTQQLA